MDAGTIEINVLIPNYLFQPLIERRKKMSRFPTIVPTKPWKKTANKTEKDGEQTKK